TQFGNLEDFGEGGADFLLTGIFQPPFKDFKHGLLAVQPGANHERKPKLSVIRGIRPAEHLDLVRAEPVQTRAPLLVRGFTREESAADQIGMRANQRELRFTGRIAHGLAKRAVQRRYIGERTFRPGRLRDPRRLFEHRTDESHEHGQVEGVQLRDGVRHDGQKVPSSKFQAPGNSKFQTSIAMRVILELEDWNFLECGTRNLELFNLISQTTPSSSTAPHQSTPDRSASV